MIGLKIKKFEEKYKILVIIALLSALCFLEYYFLFILKISTIFTHLFYIPIILACLWWKNRGLIVPIFLTGLLIFFSFFIGLNIIIDNLIRGIIFILTGYIVDILSKKMTKVEQKLRESEEKFRNILESIKEVYYEVDKRGNFTFFTEKFIELVGYPKKELLGFNYSKIVSKEDVERVYTILNNMYRKDIQEILFEYTLIQKDGTKRSFENSAYLKYDSEGNKIGFYGLARDITERKKAEQKLRESEEKYRSILENIKEAYYEVDLKGNFTFFNDILCDVLGYSKEELMKMNYREYLSDETAKIVFNSFNEIYRTEKKVKILDFEIIRKNKTKVFVELSISLKFDSHNNKNGFFGMIRDITERKKTEELRKRFSEELEEKVKIRTAELDEAIENLNETIKQKDLYVKEVLKSSQFKTEYMATMSHELRTPLNAIIGFSDLLAEEIYGRLNKEQKDFIKDVRSSGEHLFNMINQILDISKIESGEMRLNIKKFPLNNLINQIRSTVKPLLDEKKLKFEVIGLETEKFIEADQIRLKEILYNLLSNAIKFTNAGGIKLKFVEKENQLEFDIVDSGIGIAKEDYDLIFKEFKRVDSPFVDSTPGTGLGLPLTKKLINMHGGSISFTSELGKGTTFKFSIPKNLGKVAIKPDSIITE